MTAIRAILIRLLLAGMLLGVQGAHAQAPTEAQVKAAYVLNFARFTEWPAGAFAGAGSPLNVCVAGNADTLAGFGAIKGKVVQGREVQIQLAVRGGDLGSCNVLYLDATERASAAAAMKAVAGRPVLTAGDLEGFVDSGGMLGLVLVDGRIRFDANREAARANGLQLRAQLLSLARVVR